MCRTCGPRFISPSTLLNPRQSLASHWSKFQSQAKAWHLKLDYRLHRYTYPLLCICICMYNCVYIHVHTNIPCSVLTSQNVTSVSTIILQTYWKKCFPYFLIKYSLACVFWCEVKVKLSLFSLASAFHKWPQNQYLIFFMIKLPFCIQSVCGFHQHVQTFIMLPKRPWIIWQTTHFWGLTCF